jgi:endonuclease YncB( thermonuclease family)
MLRIAFLAIIFASSSPAQADITGTASVIDGDTIEVHAQRIRFHGIDAPESRQTCVAGGEVWRCGQQASLALSDFIGRSPVVCQEQGKDHYGRIIGACSVRNQDIEAWMVLNGWALAYRKYSTDYVGQEQAAQAARRGIWRGEFVPPWAVEAGKKNTGPHAPG